jgi:hypothetical protein
MAQRGKDEAFQTAVEGIPALVPEQRQTCETCALTKSAKTINQDAAERTMGSRAPLYLQSQLLYAAESRNVISVTSTGLQAACRSGS